jgi:hypothetical protein
LIEGKGIFNHYQLQKIFRLHKFLFEKIIESLTASPVLVEDFAALNQHAAGANARIYWRRRSESNR